MPRSYCPECHQLHDLEKNIHCPKMTRAEAIVSTCSTCANRTILDEIQEALDLDPDPNAGVATGSDLIVRQSVNRILRNHANPLLALARAAAEAELPCDLECWEPEGHHSPGCQSRQRVRERLRTLDPRLLGES